MRPDALGHKLFCNYFWIVGYLASGVFKSTAGTAKLQDARASRMAQTSGSRSHTYESVRKKGRRLVVIWDGAPGHRAKLVQQAAKDLDIELIPLPGYSPHMNPIEGLWKWMRKEATQLCCHPNLKALYDACKAFVETINTNPLDLIKRLRPKFKLDPREENSDSQRRHGLTTAPPLDSTTHRGRCDTPNSPFPPLYSRWRGRDRIRREPVSWNRPATKVADSVGTVRRRARRVGGL